MYSTLARKVKLGYKWVVGNTRANFIVKADDDMFLRVGSLSKYIEDNDYFYNKEDLIYSGIFARNSSGNLKVFTKGKWKETLYKREYYPKFALGSAGHMVSRNIASYISENSENLIEYHGEDTSVGIWLHEAPFYDDVIYDNNYLFTGSASCMNKKGFPVQKYVIGHMFKPDGIRDCYAVQDEVEEKTVIIGLGSGRCGTLEFSQLHEVLKNSKFDFDQKSDLAGTILARFYDHFFRFRALSAQYNTDVTHEWFACSGLSWNEPSYKRE